MSTMKRRKLCCFGHFTRHNTISNNILLATFSYTVGSFSDCDWSYKTIINYCLIIIHYSSYATSLTMLSKLLTTYICFAGKQTVLIFMEKENMEVSLPLPQKHEKPGGMQCKQIQCFHVTISMYGAMSDFPNGRH